MIKKNSKYGLFSLVDKFRIVIYAILFILLLISVYKIILT